MSSEATRTSALGRDPSVAEQIARPALLLASLAAVGLLLTLAWQLAIAALFGTSAELDAFWIGAAIPKAVADSFHLGVITLLFVVVFNMPRDEGAAWECDRLLSSVFNVVLLGTLVLAGTLFATAPQLVRWMGPGLDPVQLPAAAGVLRALTLLMVPTALVGAMAGILHAQRNFVPFALSRSTGLALQIAVLLLARRLGTQALVWAMLAGAAAMFFTCLPSFRRTGFSYKAAIEFRGIEARSVLRMLVALLLLGALARANQMSDRFFASLLGEGNVSALEFGWRFEIPVSQILAFSIALPSFALMALQSSSGRLGEFRETVGASVRLTALLVGPVILFVLVMREPLALLWFQRGAFSPEAVQRVASLIPFLAVVFTCLAFGPAVVFGLLLLRQERLLLGVLSLEVLANTALNWPLSQWIGVRGVALATATAMIASNAVLWTILLRRIGGVQPALLWRQLARTVLVAGGAAVFLLATRVAIWSAFAVKGAIVTLGVLAVVGLLYLAMYVTLCNSAGLVEVRFTGLRPTLRLAPER